MKVAIIGGGESWKEAPFNDESWDIWVLGNQMNRYLDKRVTCIFELHENLSEHDPKYPQWLKERAEEKEANLITSESWPLMEYARPFHYEGAKKLIGVEYFTSSPACMMAQAIMDGATEIAIYGIDMSVDDHEYFLQRPVMEGWIGFAKGKGIKVTIAEGSSLHKYTYNEGRDWNNKPKGPVFSKQEFDSVADEHAKAKEKIQAQIENLKMAIAAHDGAEQACRRFGNVARSIDSGIAVQSLKEGVNVKNRD